MSTEFITFGPWNSQNMSIEDPDSEYMRYHKFKEDFSKVRQHIDVTPFAIIDDYITVPDFQSARDGSYYWDGRSIKGWRFIFINIPYDDLKRARFDTLERAKDILEDFFNSILGDELYKCNLNWYKGDTLRECLNKSIGEHIRVLHVKGE